jgi:hypothetical protein
MTMILPNWEIWTSLRFLSKDFALRKLALPTMLVPRCGKTSPMTKRAIFGL